MHVRPHAIDQVAQFARMQHRMPHVACCNDCSVNNGSSSFEFKDRLGNVVQCPQDGESIMLTAAATPPYPGVTSTYLWVTGQTQPTPSPSPNPEP